MYLDCSNAVLVVPVKVCSKCGEVKPAATEYFQIRKCTQTFYGDCRECQRSRTRAWFDANQEHVAEYRRANKERTSAWSKEYYSLNRDELLRKDREYREKNRDYLRERQRIYRANNKEARRNLWHSWYTNNREYAAELNRRYREKHKDRISERNSNYKKNRRKTNWETVRDQERVSGHRYRARKRSLPDTFADTDMRIALEHFGHSCAVCGQGLMFLSHADHWIPIKSPDCPGTVPHNMVPLCSACNLSKGAKMPTVWLIEKFGPKKGRVIQRKIEAFLDSRRPDSEQSA